MYSGKHFEPSEGFTFTAIRHVRGHVTLMAACHVSTRSAVTKCLDVTAWWVWLPRTPNPRMRDLIAGCHFRSINLLRWSKMVTARACGASVSTHASEQ